MDSEQSDQDRAPAPSAAAAALKQEALAAAAAVAAVQVDIFGNNHLQKATEAGRTGPGPAPAYRPSSRHNRRGTVNLGNNMVVDLGVCRCRWDIPGLCPLGVIFGSVWLRKSGPCRLRPGGCIRRSRYVLENLFYWLWQWRHLLLRRFRIE
jgi:hypothetical protein